MRKICLAFLLGTTVPALSEPLGGTRQIVLMEQDGTRHPVGQVQFSDDQRYEIKWNETVFADHFLSMRPFRCFEGTAKHWCRVPYPYANNRHAIASDLTDLEYDLLFVWRGATDYGVNLWNGVYYKLEADGNRLVGQLHEFDLNLLAAPPEAGDMRPVRLPDLHLADPDSHWLPGLVVE